MTFGFYAKDNPGILLQDYVIDPVSGNSLNIEMSRDVNKSKLIARFTTSTNASVTISGTMQTSGVSFNDFTIPVDYIITEGSINARYTVTIMKAADFVWKRASVLMSNTTNTMIMRVNPKNANPYVYYVRDAATAAEKKATVSQFADGAWSPVGSNLGFSDGEIGTILGISFNSAGDPIVLYPDYTASVSRSATVQQFKNGAWTNLGSKGITDVRYGYGTLGIQPVTENPAIFVTNDVAGGVLERRALNIAYFNGTSWNSNQTIPGRDPLKYASLQVSKTVGDALYLGIFKNGGVQTYSVHKFQNNTWTTIIDDAIEPGATNLNLRDFDMDVDAKGNIYVVAADDASGTYKPRVKKYDAQTKTWSQVGSLVPYDFNLGRYFSLKVSPLGVPYLMYRNIQNQPTVISIDSDTKDWTSPHVLENVETTADLYIDFTPSGIGYAAFINPSNQVVLYQLGGQ